MSSFKYQVKTHPMVTLVTGNIVELFKSSDYNILLHGCNCYHVMGAGLAKELNILTQGKLMDVDRRTEYGNINKLGTTSGCHIVIDNQEKSIYNLYTQHSFGLIEKDEVYIHWDSLYNALLSVMNPVKFNVDTVPTYTANILLPKIGTSKAGGTEEEFFFTFNKFLKTFPVINPNIHFTIVE